MDKAKLTREQLLEAVKFIKGRGFRDEVVIVEILDHFACKVEDKMAADPKLSLECALKSAHADFGPMGFQRLVSSFEEGSKSRYNAAYRRIIWGWLRNPLFLAIGGLSAYLFGRGVMWGIGRGNILGVTFNPVADLFVLAYLLTHLLFVVRVPRHFRRSLFIQRARRCDILGVGFAAAMMSDAHPSFHEGVVAFGVLSGLLFLGLLLDLLASYELLHVAVDESSVVDTYMRSLSA